MVNKCTSPLTLPCMYEGSTLELPGPPLFFRDSKTLGARSFPSGPDDAPKKLWDQVKPILGPDNKLFQKRGSGLGLIITWWMGVGVRSILAICAHWKKVSGKVSKTKTLGQTLFLTRSNTLARYKIYSSNSLY
jgi:hypothetical protein